MSVATDYASVTSTRGTDVAIPATPASNRVPCLPGHRARNSIGSSSCRFRLSRELTLRTAAREYVWLYDYRHGMSLGEIALRDGISVKRVQFGVERARAQENGVSTTA